MRLKDLTIFNGSPDDFWGLYCNNPVSVLTLQAEISFLGYQNQHTGDLLKKFGVITADGVGLAWALRFLGMGKFTKCSGVDIIESLVTCCPEKKVFLWGAKENVVASAAKKYTQNGLSVVGYLNGYDYDMEEALKKIKESGAQVVLVGMAGTKQLEAVLRARERLGVTAITVGGSFDLASGKFKRAPIIFQKLGLEWFWRALLDLARVKRFGRLFLFIMFVIRERLSQ